MTALLPPQGMVRSLTVADAKRERDELIAQSGMSLDELVRRGESWALDATERGILADIQNLEFLIERASR